MLQLLVEALNMLIRKVGLRKMVWIPFLPVSASILYRIYKQRRILNCLHADGGLSVGHTSINDLLL